MGFFSKMKDILFDDVDEEENDKVKIKPEKEENEVIAKKIEPVKIQIEEQSKKQEVEQSKPNSQPNYDNLNERDLFKSDNTFNFPDFDEEEFSTSLNRDKKQTTNVLEYEKKRKTEKRYDFGKYERVETKEVVEKKKFKPSPIISPVYGILNEDYRIEDIKDKTEENRNNNLDLEAVRKKAFGTEEMQTLDEVKPSEETYEETVTVKFVETPEEKEEKVKTIDELLEETSDLIMDVKKTKEEKEEAPKEYEAVEEELEEVKPIEEPKKDDNKAIEDDETIENDLFDLIDSMYDKREDGEE